MKTLSTLANKFIFKKQMSETLIVGVLLALSGGFMDAYSYIQRGEVFANAQTGNILLFGINISQGNFKESLSYFFPFFSFALGIILAEIIKRKDIINLHWRQTSVLCEAIILVSVAFIPLTHNLLANSLTSFACGIQVESFRKIHGKGVATTMCIGNMRSAAENICNYCYTKQKKYLSTFFIYITIVCFFAIGAIIGNCVVGILKEKAILFCCFILIITFALMFINKDDE